MRLTTLAAFANRGEVPARAESAASAGDHNNVNGLIRGDATERVVKGRGQFAIQGIQSVGAIHHQGGDAIVFSFEDDRPAGRKLWSVTHRSSFQWLGASCTLQMRATSCASFLKCRSLSLLSVVFAPLVEGRTYTRAPYNCSF